LIAGDLSCAPKDAPIYPEFSVDWIIDEAYNHPLKNGNMTSSTSRAMRNG
jgi:hypothetical protein